MPPRNVRICLVTHYMPPHVGGIEQVGDLLAHEYSGQGHEVTWIATAPPATSGVERDGDILRCRIGALNVLERLQGMPFPIPWPAGLRTLRREIQRAQVVHIHDSLYLPSVAAAIVARRRSCPTVVTQHVGFASFGPLVDAPERLAYRTVARAVLRSAKHVVFVSSRVRQWFARNVDAALDGVIIPNAIDTRAFLPAEPMERVAARRSLGVPVEPTVVLFAGRLVAVKNVAVLVQALGRLAGPWHALIVGDGPLRPELARLGGRLTHLPRLPHARMPEAYRAADLFVLPSVSEGLPLSLLEALASGLPCIVSRGVSEEELSGCDAVVRVAPSVAEIAAAISTLLGDDATRDRLRSSARAWAVRTLDPGAFGARYLDILADAVAR